MDFFKKLSIIVLICCKPPVFLTLSILIVVGYLTLIVLNSIIHEVTSLLTYKHTNDPTLILFFFLVIFGVCWVGFFFSLAKYEVENELNYYLRTFQSSRKGLRCLPVTLMHILSTFTFEYLVFKTVNNSMPKDKIINNLTAVKGQNMADYEKFNVIFTYTVWICSIIYSFFYFLLEEIVILFSREETLVEFIHFLFVKFISKTTGIDLSDLPQGESVNNAALERLMNPIIGNEALVPPSRAEYNSVRQRFFVINTILKRSNTKTKNRKYLSYNTLR